MSTLRKRPGFVFLSARHQLWVSVVCILTAAASRAAAEAPQPGQSLEGRVAALEQAVFGLTNLTVDCARETVAAALARAPKAGLVTITVVGVCNEDVLVDRKMTLRGASTGGGLQALRVGGGAHVTLEGLLVRGRLEVLPDSHVTSLGSQLSSILVGGGRGGGSIDLSRNPAIGEPTTVDGGISASNGSLAHLGEGTIVQNNRTGAGLLLGDGSVGVAAAGTRILNNEIGVDVSGGSVFTGRNVAIEDNRGDGILGREGSTIVLRPGRLLAQIQINRNLSNGITLRDTSVAALTTNVTIQNNGGWGILCISSPPVAQILGAVGNVSGNGSGDIKCPASR